MYCKLTYTAKETAPQLESRYTVLWQQQLGAAAAVDRNKQGTKRKVGWDVLVLVLPSLPSLFPTVDSRKVKAHMPEGEQEERERENIR